MLKSFYYFSLVVLLFMGCKKGEPVQEFTFGSFTAQLANLPGTPTLGVYIGDTQIDSIKPGHTIGLMSPLMLSAGKTNKLTFKYATEDMSLDTVITLNAGQKASFKLAYSVELGIRSFLTSTSNISTDSVLIQPYNKLPVELQAAGVEIDAVLFTQDAASVFHETGIVWSDFKKLELHPVAVKLPLKDNSGTAIKYVIRYRNKATGAWLKDSLNRDSLNLGSLAAVAGKYIIMTFTGQKSGTRFLYTLTTTEL